MVEGRHTNNRMSVGRRLATKGTDTLCTTRDLELAETPLGTEVLWQEGSRCQAKNIHTKHI